MTRAAFLRRALGALAVLTAGPLAPRAPVPTAGFIQEIASDGTINVVNPIRDMQEVIAAIRATAGARAPLVLPAWVAGELSLRGHLSTAVSA